MGIGMGIGTGRGTMMGYGTRTVGWGRRGLKEGIPKFIMGGIGTGPLGIIFRGGECKPGK